MDLSEVDPKGLVRESYRIDGITPGECRSILLDWALSLPVGAAFEGPLATLIEVYGIAQPGHPMTQVLQDGLRPATAPHRKGGRAGRVPGG